MGISECPSSTATVNDTLYLAVSAKPDASLA